MPPAGDPPGIYLGPHAELKWTPAQEVYSTLDPSSSASRQEALYPCPFFQLCPDEPVTAQGREKGSGVRNLSPPPTSPLRYPYGSETHLEGEGVSEAACDLRGEDGIHIRSRDPQAYFGVQCWRDSVLGLWS